MPQKNSTPAAPALWNPMWAILLSFIFTPVFGGIVCGMNWRAMGKEELRVFYRMVMAKEKSHTATA